MFRKQSILKTARDWLLKVDLPESPLVIPPHIASTNQRPDIILTSDVTKRLIIVELTVPVEGRSSLSYQMKTEKYETGVAEAAELKGWKTSIYAVEMGCRGFPAFSMSRMLKEMGYTGRLRKDILKKLSRIAEECSMHIWKSSHFKSWGERV